jgi:hypothetical protein
LARGFNPTTGLRSGAKELRAAGKKAEKAISAAAPLTTPSMSTLSHLNTK